MIKESGVGGQDSNTSCDTPENEQWRINIKTTALAGGHVRERSDRTGCIAYASAVKKI